MNEIVKNSEVVAENSLANKIRIWNSGGIFWIARCDCLWVSVDKQRLKENINDHINLHKSRDGVPAVVTGEVSDFYLYYPKLPGRRKKTQQRRRTNV